MYYTHHFSKDMFKFSGKSGRVELSTYNLGYIAVMLVLIILGAGMLDTNTSAPLGILMFLGAIPLIVANWAVSVRRVRDIGLNPWWALALLVPYVGFAFSLFCMLAPANTVKTENVIET